VVQVTKPHSGLSWAGGNGMGGKDGVVLPAGEPFFLAGGDNNPVPDKRSGLSW